MEFKTIWGTFKEAEMPESDTCAACGRPILWNKSSLTHNLIPLDAEPVSTGSVVIKDGMAHTLGDSLFDAMMSGPRYKPHAETCPQLAKHRKRTPQ